MNETRPTSPTDEGRGFAARLGRIAASDSFNRLILFVIILAGILAGVETYEENFKPDGPFALALDFSQDLILWVFLAEAVVKIGSFGAKPWRYFRVGWNVFDFIIVVVCFLPVSMEYLAVLRLARTLRTLRLVTAVPGLQILVAALLRAIPSLGYVGLLLLLHFYIYAVLGTFLFGGNDPIRFGSLHVSMLTLFEVLTLEGWNDVLNTQFLGSDIGYDEAWKTLAAAARHSLAQPLTAAAYFVSFIFVGTMIMLNLFTGVIISSMEDAHSESTEGTRKQHLKEQGFLTLRDELQLLSEQVQEISMRLRALSLPDADLSDGQAHGAADERVEPAPTPAESPADGEIRPRRQAGN